MDLQIRLYKCDKCEREFSYREIIKDDIEHLCPNCEHDSMTFTRERPAQWVSVAVYLKGRSYGGPEEGGWWYDTGERYDMTIRCFEDGDFPQVQAYVDMMKHRWAGPEWAVIVYTEELPPASFPESTPRYC